MVERSGTEDDLSEEDSSIDGHYEQRAFKLSNVSLGNNKEMMANNSKESKFKPN